MDYTELLTIPGEAGIFTQPADADELWIAADRAGLARWRVDLANVRRKADLMQAFRQTLNFTEGFGANWDALNDALTERALDEPAGVILTLENCGEFARGDGEAFELLLEVLDAVAESCYDEDIAFWVFVDGIAAEDFDLPMLDNE